MSGLYEVAEYIQTKRSSEWRFLSKTFNKFENNQLFLMYNEFNKYG